MLEENALWRRVIDLKYDTTWGNWCLAECTRWVCGSILEKGGIAFCYLSDMMLVMALKFVFGMICGNCETT